MGLFDFFTTNSELRAENKRLRDLCEEKDEHFKSLMSDGMRHGSSLAASYMADRKNYLKNR